MHRRKVIIACALAGLAVLVVTPILTAQFKTRRALPGWRTNTAKRSIELNELRSGGVGKDGIPPIDRPRFVSIGDAKTWLQPNEPVVSMQIEDEARAYPLQILIWHEIVNDRVASRPVTVTFCPLCYSAIAFDREVDGRVLDFGVSGFLRNSDLVMYDRKTESLWQQLTGEAIVGNMTGAKLEKLPAQIISFEQFYTAHPRGRVLSRSTGHTRDYGRNPYAGYDNISKTPFLYRGRFDDRVPPMEKLISVSSGGEHKAYPYSVSSELGVVADSIGGRPIVVFHGEGAVSALDRPRISASREVGSTGVFDPRVDGRVLHFDYAGGVFVDRETGSAWDITGQAIGGALKGRNLTPIPHGDYFAFAWLAFRPETEIYRPR